MVGKTIHAENISHRRGMIMSKDWKELAEEGNKIAAIQAVRRLHKIGLAEAIWLVQGYMKSFESDATIVEKLEIIMTRYELTDKERLRLAKARNILADLFTL